MIIVTGAAGFIGSCLIGRLNQDGFKNIVAVDDFSQDSKKPNLEHKHIRTFVHRKDLATWIDENQRSIEFIFHIGARTDTTEFNKAIFDELNEAYSQMIWKKCVSYQLPVVYASSAATYGDGSLGYADDVQLIPKLKPLNPYGDSKNNFDLWALAQKEKPFFWAGLKFFNVYGPNEYHKGRMASVVFHAFHQIQKSGSMKLFRSHHPNYTDGGQLRDFIYVEDLVDVCIFLMHHRKNSDIYNLGTGRARTFLDLTRNVFKAMGIEEQISFIDTPIDIRDKYQYYTQAEMQKLRAIGYNKAFTDLETGVEKYVQSYLIPSKYA